LRLLVRREPQRHLDVAMTVGFRRIGHSVEPAIDKEQLALAGMRLPGRLAARKSSIGRCRSYGLDVVDHDRPSSGWRWVDGDLQEVGEYNLTLGHRRTITACDPNGAGEAPRHDLSTDSLGR
jgi:hypothetical protein